MVQKKETDSNYNNLTSAKLNQINSLQDLVCVQYPGIVKNLDAALRTLGGLRGITLASSDLRKNLELKFRPKDLYCKPSIAERDFKPSLLVKVKVKRVIENEKIVSEKCEVLDYDVIGKTALNFTFNKLCDFQYLPLLSLESKEVEDELHYMYNHIIPNELPEFDNLLTDEAFNMPYYFPPPGFSKFNQSNNQLYFDRSKFYEGTFTPEYYKKFKEQEIQQKLYRKGKERNILAMHTYICNYDDDIPMEPSHLAMSRLSAKYTTQGAVQKLTELFNTRSIWSKNALLYHSGVSLEQVKHILPTMAYYYTTGPWRVMWVKFGYDPKKDPASRILQTFDFRIRAQAGFKLVVKAKRYGHMQDSHTIKTSSYLDQKKINKQTPENSFILRPGMVPSARQMFYQYCDIHIPEVQAMMSRLPPVLPGTQCNIKVGWMPVGFAAQCREIANKYIGAQMQEILKERHIQSDGKEATATDQPSEFYEISSDSSSSSSESEDETSSTSVQKHDVDAESENELDLETVEEVNRIISMSSNQSSNVFAYPQPGPSTK